MCCRNITDGSTRNAWGGINVTHQTTTFVGNNTHATRKEDAVGLLGSGPQTLWPYDKGAMTRLLFAGEVNNLAFTVAVGIGNVNDVLNQHVGE
jgi:hypothetical protein